MPRVVVDIRKTGRLFPQFGCGGPPERFEGMKFQRGYGYRRYQFGKGALSNVLHKAWKYVVPFAQKHIVPFAKEQVWPVLKDIGKALGGETLAGAAHALTDIVAGQDAKEAVKTASTQALKNMAKRAGTRLTQAGSGRGRKRGGAHGGAITKSSKKKRVSTSSLANLHAVGRSVLKQAASRQHASGEHIESRPNFLGLLN